MRKLFLLTVPFVVAFAGSLHAADLPSHKEPVVAPPAPPLWTGFYVGLNAGYNAGLNSNSNQTLWSYGGAGYTYYGSDQGDSNFLGGVFGGQKSGPQQSGFIGGGQLGYNYQLDNNMIVGFEADFQGTTTQGSSSAAGLIVSNAAYKAGFGYFPASINQSGYDITGINAGVNWIGTARGRIGYLFTPSILVYGTAGLAYGDAWANVTSRGVANTSVTDLTAFNGPFTPPAVTQVFGGVGRASSLLVGFSAGGGFEWLLTPSWSLKAEAIYWNLGSMHVSTAAISSGGTGLVGNGPFSDPYQSYAGAGLIVGATNVNYQGVIARAGVNYHFNLASAPIISNFQ